MKRPITGKADWQERLRGIRHVALDMDGTIYLGERLFPMSIPFLEQLSVLGIGYTFLTNNSSKSRDEYVRKLARMGLAVEPEQVQTSTHALIAYLRRELPDVRRLYALGTPAFHNELGASGYVSCEEEPDAVVIAFDLAINYERLCRAAWWISRGKPFLATHPDRVCPTDRPTVLIDCGAICDALVAATGVKPVVVGKPQGRMLEPILHRTGLQPGELMMVGDRLMTDVKVAKAVGALSVLVLTGEATREEAAALPETERPDLILEDVGVLGDWLEDAHALSSPL